MNLEPPTPSTVSSASPVRTLWIESTRISIACEETVDASELGDRRTAKPTPKSQALRWFFRIGQFSPGSARLPKAVGRRHRTPVRPG